MKQDPIESKLEDSVSGKVKDVPKQVEHIIPRDTNHDVTSPDDHTNLPHLEHEQDRSIVHDRPRRNARAPSRFSFEDYVAYVLQVAKEVESLEPATYREAITLKDSDMWITAIGEEIESLYNNNTWELSAPTWSLIYLLLYVDDMLVAAKDMEEIKKLKILLNTEFDMKDLGATRKILGISNVGLIYGGERESLVVGYSYSDYTVDLDARRSLTGYVFTIGNLVVSWKATLQPSVALSTTEAEYMALTEAAKEGIWLKGLIEDLGFPQDQATVFCDSMSAMCLAKDQVYHDQTKHIDVRYHFIRTERRIKVNKIGTEDNPADLFTKPIPLSKLCHYLDLLNIDNWKYGVT
ncbi:retrovirus-related pol polyprotein from transposon TNT 1-94 [Tanacetum coccineum]